jgi:hypothetical protein
MKFLGFEFRRIPPEQPDPLDRMIAACDEMNAAWRENKAQGGKERPWVLWDEHRMIITSYSGEKVIIHE